MTINSNYPKNFKYVYIELFHITFNSKFSLYNKLNNINNKAVLLNVKNGNLVLKIKQVFRVKIIEFEFIYFI